ncbi:MAG: DoxX family membrane protein [Rhizomicrobium sp.]
MSLSELISPLIGRWLLAWYFLSQGWALANDWNHTVLDMLAHGLPVAPLLLALALLVMLLGSLSLILGYQTRYGAVMLFALVVLSSIAMHAFWLMHSPAQQAQYELFARNLAIAGGLLLLVGMGPGRFALDNRPPPKRR